MSDPARLGVFTARTALETGAVTAGDLVAACLARIGDRDGEVRAWCHLADDAVAAAERASGLLAGIPFGVKDIIDTHDMPTGHGSKIYAGHRPARDAGCVALLRAAGAVPLGKTHTTEFAFRHPGPTRNPHALDRTPGGSSSGSAAAVADCMVPFALGTQTLGSVIRPASFCGIVGYKPSFGEITRSGVFEVATSLDTVGVFARDARDLALLRAALAAIAHAPEIAPAPSTLRFAVWRDGANGAASEAAWAVVEATAGRLEQAGARRVELAVPESFGAAPALQEDIACFEIARAAAFERTQRADQLSAVMREQIMARGMAVTLDAHHGALAAFDLLRRQYAELVRDIDVVLAPAALGEAPRGLESTGDPACNKLWTALHVPAVTLPAGRGPAGLPLGVQLVGHGREDARLLAIAESVQALLAATAAAAP